MPSAITPGSPPDSNSQVVRPQDLNEGKLTDGHASVQQLDARCGNRVASELLAVRPRIQLCGDPRGRLNGAARFDALRIQAWLDSVRPYFRHGTSHERIALRSTKTRFEENMKIVCADLAYREGQMMRAWRHSANQQRLPRAAQRAMDLANVTKISEAMVPAHEYGRHLLRGSSNAKTVVGESGWPYFLTAAFSGLSPGEGCTYLAVSNKHATAFDLRHKAANPTKPARYVLLAYDPNFTWMHRKLVVNDLGALAGTGLSTFFPRAALRAYYSGNNRLTALTALAEPGQSQNRLAIASGDVTEFLAEEEQYSPKYLYFLLFANAHDAVARLCKAFLARPLARQNVMSFLEARGGEGPGHFYGFHSALLLGHVEAVKTYITTVIDAFEQGFLAEACAYKLLQAESDYAVSGLAGAMRAGHVEVVEVYLAGVEQAWRKQVLARGSLQKIFMARVQGSTVGLYFAVHQAHASAVKAYLARALRAFDDGVLSQQNVADIFELENSPYKSGLELLFDLASGSTLDAYLQGLLAAVKRAALPLERAKQILLANTSDGTSAWHAIRFRHAGGVLKAYYAGVCNAFDKQVLSQPEVKACFEPLMKNGQPVTHFALAHGHAAFVVNYCKAVFEAKRRGALAEADIVSLFGSASKDGVPGLVVAAINGQGENVRVFCAAVIDSFEQGLISAESLKTLLNGSLPDGTPGFRLVMRQRWGESVHAYLDSVFRACQCGAMTTAERGALLAAIR